MNTKEKFTNFVNSVSSISPDDSMHQRVLSNGDIELDMPDGMGGRAKAVFSTSPTIGREVTYWGGYNDGNFNGESQHYWNGDTSIQTFPNTVTSPDYAPGGYGSGGNGNSEHWVLPNKQSGWSRTHDHTIVGSPDYDRINIKKKIEELEKSIEKVVPNKIDKDLIDTKIPYNVKKDLDANLIYMFAIAGYKENQIELVMKKDGLLLKLKSAPDDNDLIGEGFEYLCHGIKDSEQEVGIYLDVDEYETANSEVELDNGILQIFIPRRKELKNRIKVKAKPTVKKKIDFELI